MKPSGSFRTGSVCARLGLAAVACAGALSLAEPAGAQASGEGFLFSAPRFTLAVRGGFAHASARSDVFDFTREHLTLDRNDFSGWSIGGDLAIAVKPQVDLVLGAAYASSTAPSEFREFIGTDDLPILQTTRFTRIPVTVSLKTYLLPRGETIGSLAWVPSRFSPFLGIGGGVMAFRFEQKGEFVDFEDFDIFEDRLSAKGTAPMVHGLAGADFSLTPRLGVTTEARYTWAKGNMVDEDSAPSQQDFAGFDKIDLSGFSLTMGLHIRFR